MVTRLTPFAVLLWACVWSWSAFADHAYVPYKPHDRGQVIELKVGIQAGPADAEVNKAIIPMANLKHKFNQILNRSHILLDFKVMPAARALLNVQSGDLDAVVSTQRLGHVVENFSVSDAVTTVSVGFLTRVVSQRPNLNSFHDLIDLNVALFNGDMLRAELAGRGINYREIASMADVQKMLINNRVDGILGFKEALAYIAPTAVAQDQLIIQTLLEQKVYLVICNKRDDSAKLLARINQAIAFDRPNIF